MSLLPGFEQELYQLAIQAVQTVPGDFGAEKQVLELTPKIPISAQKASSQEKIQAGVEAATVLMKCYSGPDLDERINEMADLRLEDANGAAMGSWNCRSRIEYREEHVELELTRVNTA